MSWKKSKIPGWVAIHVYEDEDFGINMVVKQGSKKHQATLTFNFARNVDEAKDILELMKESLTG